MCSKYKFIKVFSEEDKQVLLALGFQLIYEDKNTCTFLNNPKLIFDDRKVKFTYSNILTF